MYHYAYLNQNDVVEAIYTLPSVITDPKYILIPEYDESLIGKKYNRETGEFEDIPVSDLEELEKKVGELESKLTGHEASRANPHTVTKAQVGLGNVDNTSDASKPVSTATQNAINTVGSKVTTLENAVLGGYKVKPIIKSNERISTKKRVTYTFDTGIPGYFPRMVRLSKQSGGRQVLLADIYMVRDSSGRIVKRYVDTTYYGTNFQDIGAGKATYSLVDQDAGKSDIFKMGKSGGDRYDEGGSAFYATMNPADGEEATVGNFEYNENSLSFDFEVTDGLYGASTNMSLYMYVF